MRLDVYLTAKGFSSSRQRAQSMIKNNEVTVDGTKQNKPSCEIDETISHTIVIEGDSNRYVSRGGLKLEAALRFFNIDVCGKKALDVGASTGGFTDCLLQHGAAAVYAVDVGETQLHDSLKQNDKVVVADHCNARFLSADSFPVIFDVATMDVSFISQTLIYPALHDVLPNDAILISLIKPQFEVGPKLLNKHGIVTDSNARRQAVTNVLYAACKNGLCPFGLMKSPITGGDGNVEYLFAAKRSVVNSDAGTESISRLIKSLEAQT